MHTTGHINPTEHFVKPDQAKHLKYLNRMEEADMVRPGQDADYFAKIYHQDHHSTNMLTSPGQLSSK